MKRTLLCTLPFLLASMTFAQSVADIVKEHETAKAAALQKYIDATPDAADKDEAIDALIAAYSASGNVNQGIVMYDLKYAALEKGAEASMRDVAIGYVQPYMAFLAEHDREDIAKKTAEKITTDFKGHDEAEALGQFLEGMMAEFKVPKVGDTLEIAGTSLDGMAIDLADMKGKVVLVDFWATWCGPCVAEIPNMKAAYAKYHKDGFDVLAISLDSRGGLDASKTTVEKFIKKREMPWPQILDGKGWESPLVAKYGITGIPATFLIGKDGKIIETNLRGTGLEKSVEAALK